MLFRSRQYPDWTGESASVLRRGTDVTLVSYGPLTDELLDAAELLAEKGVSAEVIKLHRIAPLDTELVIESVRRTGRLLTLEDCNENGSIGQQIAAALAQAGAVPRALVLKNLKNAFAPGDGASAAGAAGTGRRERGRSGEGYAMIFR